MSDQLYINFDEYIRQGEPTQREREPDDDNKQEADKASKNIKIILSVKTCDFSTKGYQWELRNRYLHIHPTAEWSVQPNMASSTSTRTSTRTSSEQAQDLVHTNNPLILELIKVIGEEEFSISQLMEKTGLKHRPNFIEYHLGPAMNQGFVRLLYPDSPRHPRQKYLLTVKGLTLYNEIKKEAK